MRVEVRVSSPEPSVGGTDPDLPAGHRRTGSYPVPQGPESLVQGNSQLLSAAPRPVSPPGPRRRARRPPRPGQLSRDGYLSRLRAPDPLRPVAAG